MESKVKTPRELMADMKGNYVQVVMKNGKTFHKLFKNPQLAIRAVGGVDNVKYLREVLKEQVNSRYVETDALEGVKENEL